MQIRIFLNLEKIRILYKNVLTFKRIFSALMCNILKFFYKIILNPSNIINDFSNQNQYIIVNFWYFLYGEKFSTKCAVVEISNKYTL